MASALRGTDSPVGAGCARVRRLLVTVAVVCAASACTSAEPRGRETADPVPTTGSTTSSPDGLRMTRPRAAHRATLLEDGRVLVTGGCTEPGCEGFAAGQDAELFDVDRGLVPDSRMSTPRASGSATLLADGRVLLVGGYPGEGRPPTAAVEVYDPMAGTFGSVRQLATARADHSATLLPDGRVVVAGGFDSDGEALDTTEYFDPATGSFSTGPRMLRARAAHVAVLTGTTVALVGGTQDGRAMAQTEVLRPRAGVWAAGPDLATPRVKLGAVAVGGHRVFVVGGATDTEGHEKLRSTEVIDLDAGTVRPGPELSEGEYKLDGAVAVLADGRVVVGGGSSLEVYAADLSWVQRVPVPGYDARSFRTVTAVGPRSVLVLGGYDQSIEPTDAAYLVSMPA